MSNIVSWIVILALLAAAVAALGVVIKAYLTGESPAAVFFKPRAEPRLAVIEFAAVDQKRRLVLIRRDDVEHLIMTGGPVDIVVETGIRATEAASTEPSADIARGEQHPVDPPIFSQPTPAFADRQKGMADHQQALVADMEMALKR